MYQCINTIITDSITEIKHTLTLTTSLIPQEQGELQMLPVFLGGTERENLVVTWDEPIPNSIQTQIDLGTRLNFLSLLKECVDPIPGLLDGADGGGGHCLPTTVSCKELVLYSGGFVVLQRLRQDPCQTLQTLYQCLDRKPRRFSDLWWCGRVTPATQASMQHCSVGPCCCALKSACK